MLVNEIKYFFLAAGIDNEQLNEEMAIRSLCQPGLACRASLGQRQWRLRVRRLGNSDRRRIQNEVSTGTSLTSAMQNT
ncbi:MAG TPA: hypothetical protein PLS93_06580, partial [Accumulibacter sp.]|nr:hypothetical protein [Accumulibacter sp.]